MFDLPFLFGKLQGEKYQSKINSEALYLHWI